MRTIILIAHNLRSAHNVGSLLRTADGLGLQTVYLTGYTPYPVMEHDERLPHLAQKISKQITKTALGAESSQSWVHADDISTVLTALKDEGFVIAALEQAENAILLPQYKSPEKIALIVGREVEGVEHELLDACDTIIEIPMYGRKESFNVSVAAAIALYSLQQP